MSLPLINIATWNHRPKGSGNPLSPGLRVVGGVAFFCIALSFLSCQGYHQRGMGLEEMWQLCDAKDYESALPLARDFVLRYPVHPVAHFLLGKCFANKDSPELTRAKGEFDMALSLLNVALETEQIELSITVENFKVEIHYETALVLFRTALEAYDAGIVMQASLDILRTALKELEEGLHYAPDSDRLIELKEVLERMIRQATTPQSLPLYSDAHYT